MKILLITWHFPPKNVIAALRVGKLARYLHGAEHDIRVLTVKDEDGNRSLKLEVPAENVCRTDWIDIDRFVHPFTHAEAASGPNPAATAGASRATGRPSAWRRLRARVAEAYNNLFFLPDRQVGWIPPLIAEARRLTRHWRPDVIYVSGPPFSPFLAARRLSRELGVPWVAEYRDRWSNYAYVPRPGWRNRIDDWLERRVTASAAAIVTVSAPWSDYYRERFDKPVATVLNGYDPADFPAKPADDIPRDGCVRIAHMGSLYSGLRDPSPLFAAIARSDLTPAELRVQFYGTQEQHILPLAREFRVEAYVEVAGALPYGRAVARQRISDVLLLLQWNDPDDKGNVPGKFFEYLAARRPILGIGQADGVPARLIREREAGLYSNDPDAILAQLARWIDQKRDQGGIAPTPDNVCRGFSRDEQFAQLDGFLGEVLDRNARPAAGRAGGFRRITDLAAAARNIAGIPLQRQHQWFLAYRTDPAHFIANTTHPDLAGFTPILPPKDRFFADPFVFTHQGRDHVFFEDFDYRRGKGSIACLAFDENGRPGRPQTVLRTDYHLSYPFLFEWEGEIYLLPETAETNNVRLFRCRQFPDQWEPDREMLEGRPLVDATVHEHEGRWYMFVNGGEAGGSLSDELFLFIGETPLGPWRPHPANPIKSDIRSARPAGRLFRRNGELIRPAQDCAETYGHAINLCRVEELSETRYRERIVDRIEPSWRAGISGCHTLSFSDRLEVIDGKRQIWKSTSEPSDPPPNRST